MKKNFQINIEKNGPIAGPEMESCPRECTVCPDANTSKYQGSVVSEKILNTQRSNTGVGLGKNFEHLKGGRPWCYFAEKHFEQLIGYCWCGDEEKHFKFSKGYNWCGREETISKTQKGTIGMVSSEKILKIQRVTICVVLGRKCIIHNGVPLCRVRKKNFDNRRWYHCWEKNWCNVKSW